MEAIKVIQQRIKQKREAWQKADDDYYNALQTATLAQRGIQTGTPVSTPADIESKRKIKNDLLQSLNEEINTLNNQSTPQQLIEQISSAWPFLLMPLRIEARYVTIRHIIRHLSTDDAVDMSNNSRFGQQVARLGFEKDEEGTMTYQVWSYHLSGLNSGFSAAPGFEELKPKSGKFIKRKNDIHELRIRIYPDELFMEAMEYSLQPGEWEAGIAYWKAVCSGAKAKDEWTKLSMSVTPARAAWIIRATQPENFTTTASLPAQPKFATIKPLKDGAYTRPPITRMLPECFTVRLYKNNVVKEFTGKLIPEPLVLGLDPTDDPFHTNKESGMQQSGAALQTPEYLQWIHDFEAAKNKGLAISIDLTANPEYKEGVDKIVVAGIKLSADETESSRLMHELFKNHLYKEEGISILPKGTPTNNFGKDKAGFDRREYDAGLYFSSQWEVPAAVLETDGAKLAKTLGLNKLFRIPFGHCTDLGEAALMNKMLWPATMGYYLLQFFTPQLDEKTREQLRLFFINRVSGRGSIPVMRINRQPYGIIPVSSYKLWQYGTNITNEEEKLASQIWSFLSKLNPIWQSLTANIKTTATAGSNGLDESFFEMMKHTPSAASVHRQWMIGNKLQQAMRIARGNPTDAELARDPSFKPGDFMRLLVAMGFDHTLFNSLLNAFHTPKEKIERVFIEDLLPSEIHLPWPMNGKKWNYLQWLAQDKIANIWNDDLSGVPAGDPADASPKPLSVFYILARQALLRAFLETGMRVAETHPGLWLLKVKDFEVQQLQSNKIVIDKIDGINKLFFAFQPIVSKFQIAMPFELETDRWNYFQKAYPATGSLPLADWMDANKNTSALPQLRDILSAVSYFSKQPTAKIERLFAEHLDICSHRLDAWMEALAMQRINKQRIAKPTGIYLGSYGYLLNLKPNASRSVIFSEVQPEYINADANSMNIAAIPLIHATAAKQQGIDIADKSWQKSFFYIGENPAPRVRLNTATGKAEPDELINISKSDGFIHAPSSAHATSAAIIRNGFLNHKADEHTALLAVQLNSPRVRQAMQMLEGMQQGIGIGELLGYYFERLLHDNNADAALYNLRLAFPLQRTADDNSSPSTMTTIDGMKLLQSRRKKPTLPGWLENKGINSADFVKINNAALRLEDYLDSLGDLLLAESVYQMAKGNRDRAAAALRIMNSGGQVIMPEFVRTPMKGSAITHRTGIVFTQRVLNTIKHAWTTKGTPRSLLSPDLNFWLSQQLPLPSKIKIVVKLKPAVRKEILVSDLGIEPLDLLYIMPENFNNAHESLLATLVQSAAMAKFNIDFPVDGQNMQIDFKDRSTFNATEFSLFEISTLVYSLKDLISKVRPVSPNDFILPDKPAAFNDTTNATELKTNISAVTLPTGHIATIIQSLRDDATALNGATDTAKPDTTIKPLIKKLITSLQAAWQYGVTKAGSEGICYWNSESIKRWVTKAESAAAELESKLNAARKSFADIPATLTGELLFKKLRDIATALFDNTVAIFAFINVQNANELKECYANRNLIDNTKAMDIDEWMREASLVRKQLSIYRRAVLIREALSDKLMSSSFTVLQFPFLKEKQPWIGGKIPAETNSIDFKERASLSVLLETPSTFVPENLFSGFIIDEWPEWIPDRQVDTAVTFQYNQPNSEPAQSMLLAVTPAEGGNWKWEYLTGAIDEALDMAKRRLVTPDMINTNAALRQTLPAVTLPFMKENNQTPVAEKL